MTTTNFDYIDSDSTDTMIDYSMEDCDAALENFFRSFDFPPLPFYDTPQKATFRWFPHKKAQLKRRVLEYRAKY